MATMKIAIPAKTDCSGGPIRVVRRAHAAIARKSRTSIMYSVAREKLVPELFLGAWQE
jgi:hypothetical protein